MTYVPDFIMKDAKILGWPFSRTNAMWYGIARVIHAEEMDQLRQVACSIGMNMVG